MTKNHAPAREADANSWRLEPHCCRACFGRVVSRREGDTILFQCSNCGVEAAGAKASVICACGMKTKKARADGRSSMILVDAGLRCHENRARTPAFPALFVASYGGAQPESDS